MMIPQNTTSIAPTANPPTSANQWRDQTSFVKQFSFTGVPCLKVYMDRKKPIDFFKLLVTNKLANMMVLETKQYANQEIN